jgi:WD40 repeat protein
VKLWDAATGKEQATLKGHTGEVECVSWSPDGKTLASASADKTVKLWEVSLGK